jgi:hypothetical protein
MDSKSIMIQAAAADFIWDMVEWGYIPACHRPEALKLVALLDPKYVKEIQL